MAYTNSSLVSYTKLSPNHSGLRNHTIDTITIHCVVGQCSVETLGSIFADADREASCNYAIGYDGRIALIVEEKNRSWCSSSSSNDNRAITIEVASDTYEPYKVNSNAYNALIKLVADICKRNNIKKLLWKADKSLIGQVDKQNMTVHRWFANKSCPGDYLYNRHGQIASEVNKLLGSSTTSTSTSTKTTTVTESTTNKTFPSVPFTVDVLVSNLYYYNTPSGKKLKATGKNTFTITEVKNGWGKLKSGAGWINLTNASNVKIGSSVKTTSNTSKTTTSTTTSEYKVKITADVLNVRSGPGINYNIVQQVKENYIYTIVKTKNGWGKLKSGAGWINLSYTKTV